MKKPSAALSDESGMSLVEIVVSMFILALLAMSFLPILIQGMRSSVSNAIQATAGQLVSQQMDHARALPAICEGIVAFGAAVIEPTTDARGTVFQPHREVGACPASYPGVVSVRVWITEGSDTTALAEAKTLIYVSSAAVTP